MNKLKSPIAIGGVVLSDNSNDFCINGSIIQTVESASYNPNNTALNGIKIGDTTYRLIPQGTPVDNSVLAIGGNSRVIANRAIAIGYDAQAQTFDTIAIGPSAKSSMRYAVVFDDDGGNYDKFISLRDTSKIFFRNERNNISKSFQSQYTNGHTLKDYIGGEATLVETFTATGDESTIEITVDENSNAFSYDGVLLEVTTPAGTTTFQYQLLAFAGAATPAFFTTASGQGVGTNTGNAKMSCVKKNNIWYSEAQSRNETVYFIDCLTAQGKQTFIDNVTYTKITKVVVKSSNGADTFPANTVIKVYAF